MSNAALKLVPSNLGEVLVQYKTLGEVEKRASKQKEDLKVVIKDAIANSEEGVVIENGIKAVITEAISERFDLKEARASLDAETLAKLAPFIKISVSERLNVN